MSDDNDILHYGVKGMRWGVRNDDVVSGSKPYSNEAYLKVLKDQPTPSVKQQQRNIAESKAKVRSQTEPSTLNTDAPKTGWRPSKKQVGTVIAGAAFTGLVVYGGYKVAQGKGNKEKEAISLLKDQFDWATPGSKITPNKFMESVSQSQAIAWGKEGYFSKELFDRPSYTIPAGTMFHRLSQNVEDSFSKGGTYMVHSVEDYHRYIFSLGEYEMGGATGRYHITSKAKGAIRVADLNTSLDAVRVAMKNVGESDVSPKAVLRKYQSLSGTGWSVDGLPGAILKELKTRGYGAMIDVMDVDVMGDSPIVLFDSGSMGKKSSSKISLEDVMHAGENLKELTNRRGAS